MTKMQIGWKARDNNNDWYLHQDKPVIGHAHWYSNVWLVGLKDHPEQPEIDWKDSLKPVFIEVDND